MKIYQKLDGWTLNLLSSAERQAEKLFETSSLIATEGGKSAGDALGVRHVQTLTGLFPTLPPFQTVYLVIVLC